MSDEFDREVRTTTTTTDGGVEREVHTTRTVAEPARSGGGAGLWVVLGLIAIVAIVALVYFTQNKAPTDELTINAPTAVAPATTDANRAIGDASAAVASAAEETGDAAARTADAVGDAVTTEPSASQ